MRVRSVAHGVDGFIIVPSCFLERNNSLVDLLGFIVQSENRLPGIVGSYVIEDVSSIPQACLFFFFLWGVVLSICFVVRLGR